MSVSSIPSRKPRGKEQNILLQEMGWACARGLQLDDVIEETYKLVNQQRKKAGKRPVKPGSRKPRARKSNP